MFRKRGSSRCLSRSQALRRVPCRQASPSMTLPYNRSPLTSSHHLEPPSTVWPPFVTPVASSRPRRHDGFKRAVSEKKRKRFVSISCKFLYLESSILQKTLQLVTSRPHTHNLTTKQRAPRSQKRAGAETTLRTAWIERPVLSGFGLNDPPAGGDSKQVPEAAVVRDGLNPSPQTCLFM